MSIRVTYGPSMHDFGQAAYSASLGQNLYGNQHRFTQMMIQMQQAAKQRAHEAKLAAEQRRNEQLQLASRISAQVAMADQDARARRRAAEAPLKLERYKRQSRVAGMIADYGAMAGSSNPGIYRSSYGRAIPRLHTLYDRLGYI